MVTLVHTDTTKRVYSYWFLENTPKFKKIYSACFLLALPLFTVYAAAGADSDRGTLHVSSALQLVQALTDEHYTCRLCYTWCRIHVPYVLQLVQGFD